MPFFLSRLAADASTEQSMPQPGQPNGWRGGSGWLPWLLWSMFFLLFFRLTGKSPFVDDMDQSWCNLLAHAVKHEWRFGVDFIFNYGPLGFAQCIGSFGELPMLRGIYAISLAGLTATTLMQLLRRLSPAVFGMMAVVVWLGYPDNLLGWLAACAMLQLVWLGRMNRDQRYLPLLLIFLGAAANGKFTATVTVWLLMLIGFVTLLLRGERRSALLWLALPLFGLVTSWWLLGQRLEDIGRHWAWNLNLAAYYAATTVSNDLGDEFLIWAALTWVVVGTIAWFCRPTLRPSSLRFAPFYLFVAYLLAAEWKHSVIQLDAVHLGYFFFACLGLLSLLFALQAQEGGADWAHSTHATTSAGSKQRHLFLLMLLLLGLSAAALSRLAPEFTSRRMVLTGLEAAYAPVRLWEALMHLYPGAPPFQLVEPLPVPSKPPAFAQMMDKSRMDVIGSSQGTALLLGLNYQPRPFAQNQLAYTPEAYANSLAFMRSERAQEYLLWQPFTFRRGLSALEDPLAFNEMLFNYELAAEDPQWLLLRKLSARKIVRYQLIDEREVSLNEVIALPQYKGLMAYSVTVERTWLGKLRGLLFQPGRLETRLQAGERTHGADTPPELLGVPSLIQPIVDYPQDLAAVLRNQPIQPTERLELHTKHPSAFQPKGLLRLYRLVVEPA